MTEERRPYGLVKIFRPNKRTKKLEYIKSVDPFKELPPANNPYRSYPYKFKRKEITT
tara:strand:+ start:145 stop:315 length:171 start_codon:yes stop_codon:yes gene_type:complete